VTALFTDHVIMSYAKLRDRPNLLWSVFAYVIRLKDYQVIKSFQEERRFHTKTDAKGMASRAASSGCAGNRVRLSTYSCELGTKRMDMDVKILLYVDEWVALKDNVSKDSAAQGCLQRENWLTASPGQPNVEVVCNDAYAFELLQEAERCCPRAVPRIKMALNAQQT
jgi:hypothetical protein